MADRLHHNGWKPCRVRTVERLHYNTGPDSRYWNASTIQLSLACKAPTRSY